jgi:cytochrome c oxidase assembly protein subunit 15
VTSSGNGIRLSRALAVGLVAITYVLLVFGSTVRINDAGLACPDWPMCFGRVVPLIDFGVALEFGHRVLAGIVSLLFVGLGAVILSHRDLRRSHGTVWAIAAVVLAVQIVLGGLTVLELLAEWTVTSHLVAGNTFCALLLLLALRLHEHERLRTREPLTIIQATLPFVLLGAVFVQLALGGLVASSHAGLACGPVWPNCGGSAWFPTFQGSVGLQVIHRIGAYTVLAVAMLALAACWTSPTLRRVIAVTAALLVAQAGLGILNVWLAMPAEVTALHSAGAAASVLAVGWTCYEAARAPRRGRSR